MITVGRDGNNGHNLEDAGGSIPCQIGNHPTWQSEAGRVSRSRIRMHRKNVEFKRSTHPPSAEDQQLEIKRARTDHIAMRKSAALTEQP